MTPLTQDPTVVIRINPYTLKIVDVASNIAPDLTVKIVTRATEYEAEACNKPFDTLHPVS
jgi:hypothetical protein